MRKPRNEAHHENVLKAKRVFSFKHTKKHRELSKIVTKSDTKPIEAEVEANILAAGKTAPRLTPNLIDAQIKSEMYHHFPGTSLTVCVLVLSNGFTVTGESASASLDNFDVKIGRMIARTNAREKIWALEGYLLRQRLFEGGVVGHTAAV